MELGFGVSEARQSLVSWRLTRGLQERFVPGLVMMTPTTHLSAGFTPGCMRPGLPREPPQEARLWRGWDKEGGRGVEDR